MTLNVLLWIGPDMKTWKDKKTKRYRLLNSIWKAGKKGPKMDTKLTKTWDEIGQDQKKMSENLLVCQDKKSD